MNILNMAQSIGLSPQKIASTNGGEYACACPNPACDADQDGFRMWPSKLARKCMGSYWCRKCGKSGDTIQFAREFLSLSFREAADKANASSVLHAYQPIQPRSYTTPALTPPPEQWQTRASKFVQWASVEIHSNPIALELLQKRGLPQEAVLNYRLGYCSSEFFIPCTDFGLQGTQPIRLPKGLVIPIFEPSGKLIRLKLRLNQDHCDHANPKYWEISGSMKGLNIIGSPQNPILVVVESELDGYALHYACGDFLFAIAVGSNCKNPDNVSDYWAKRRRLFICHDNDSAGVIMSEKWKKWYPHSQNLPVPFGKDIGDAVGMGLNLRKWIQSEVNHE